MQQNKNGTWSSMNMQNKIFYNRKSGFLVLILLVLLSSVLPLHAQQNSKRNRKKEIKVPQAVLECPYTKEDIQNKLNHFNVWINVWAEACEKQDFNQMLSMWTKTLKDPNRYSLIDLKPFVFVPRELPEEKKKKQKKNRKKQEAKSEEPVAAQQQTEGTFYYLTQRDFLIHYDSFAVFLKFSRLTDDLQEATRFDKEAFLRYDKVIRKLEEVLKKMDNIRNREIGITVLKEVFETEFKPALKAAVVAYEQLQKTKRMSSEKRIMIEEKNKERRRKAYIARMMREQAQQDDQPREEKR